MNVLIAVLASAAVAAGFSMLTVYFLRRPLDVLLRELCGNEARARFWSVFWSIAIVLTGLLGVLVSFPLGDEGRWAGHPGAALVLVGFRTRLFFLLLRLAALALVLLVSIGPFERAQRAERRGQPAPPWSGPIPPPIQSREAPIRS